MSLDLLASLRQEAGVRQQDEPGHPEATDEEGQVEGSDQDLNPQLSLYDEIKSRLEVIDRNTETIRDITKKLKTTTSESVRQQILKDKDEAITSTTQNGLAVKRLLDRAKRENEEWVQSYPEVRDTARYDMRVTLFNTWLRRFDAVITESNSQIVSFKSVLDNIEKRQLRNVLPDMSDEDMQSVIESGKSAQVVQQALVSDNLQDTVRMIEERHDEILKLEMQVREIFELFNELATLVDLQQESLDVITVNVHNTLQKVAAAEDQLVSAREYQKKARNRKICCCLLLFCIIAAAVLIPTLVSAAVRNNSIN